MYQHMPLEMIAQDLLVAALGLQGVCVTSGEGVEVPEAESVSTLAADDINYRIVGGRDDEQLEKAFRVLEGYSSTSELEPGDVHEVTTEYTVDRVVQGTQTDDDGKVNEWMTIRSEVVEEVSEVTVEDSVIVHDQYHQADLDASEGGWSYYGPEAWDTERGDTRPMHTWAAFRLHLKRAKEAREIRATRIFDWLRAQTSAKAINKQWWKFTSRCSDGYKAYKAAGKDTTKLYLTYAQKENLARYRSIRLRQLP